MKTQYLVLSAVFLCLCRAVVVAADAPPPNIVLIMADDIGWECFSDYGGEDYKTPNLDALAAQGLRFTNCFSTPICTTSRVKLMTGRYNFRNYTHFGYLHPQEKTFAHMLKQAGYKTAIAGKWQLNGLYHKAPESLDMTRPTKAGFDEHCLWQVTKGKRDAERFWSPLLQQNGKILSIEDNHGKYGPDIMSDFVCDFIERNKKGPFFVYYPMVLVHDPFVATPATIGDAPRTQAANKAPKSAAAKKANFVAMVHHMDSIIGKIVKQVEAAGQLDNTIILFTADNGTNVRITSRWQGRDIQGGKGSTKDMGTHVPLVAYWKGKTPKGAVREDLIDFTDFYATFAAAAGVKRGVTDPVDGRSFLPQLNGQKGEPRDWVLCHYQPYWGSFQGRQFVRDQRFKLYRDGSLFDVPSDLQEAQDLSKQATATLAQAAHGKLKAVLNSAPPAPPVKSGKALKKRPVYPDWPVVGEPGD
jgi:arylsulfatase A-like enzyme